MCQYQLSSLMLPSEAPMPPWAATVCDRVGNTLESTATLIAGLGQLQRTAHAGAAGADDHRVELASRQVVRKMVQSTSAISNPPESDDCPAGIAGEQHDRDNLQQTGAHQST
jgi:hypothetical protein